MPLQALAHHSPAKSRSKGNRDISLLYTQHVLIDEVNHLSVERRLESVRNVPGKLLPQVDRLFPDRRIKRHGLLDSLGRRFSAPNYFHQGDDVRRIERMPDEDTLRAFAFRLDNARRDPRRTRGDD